MHTNNLFLCHRHLRLLLFHTLAHPFNSPFPCFASLSSERIASTCTGRQSVPWNYFDPPALSLSLTLLVWQLLKSGASFEPRDAEGNTALDIARMCESAACLEVLQEPSPDLQAVNVGVQCYPIPLPPFPAWNATSTRACSCLLPTARQISRGGSSIILVTVIVFLLHCSSVLHLPAILACRWRLGGGARRPSAQAPAHSQSVRAPLGSTVILITSTQ